MALAFSYHGTIYIVLDEENVGRIQKNDPFDFTRNQTMQLGMIRMPPEIVIAYAKKEEAQFLASLPLDEAVKHLRRGYTETATDRQRMLLVPPPPEGKQH